MKIITSLIALTLNFIVFAQTDSLIAYYPLASTPNDTTGQSDPMILSNTPFLGGGIYCNGIYQFSGIPDWCQAETPILPASFFESFTVSAKFKVDSIGNPPFQFETAVLSGGSEYRWIACILKEDSTVALKYNNFNYKASSLHFTMNNWHEFKITYNTIDTTTRLYLDDVLACSVQAKLIHGNQYDRTFSVTDGSVGNTFKGFLKDLKIYTKVPLTGIKQPVEFDAFKLYPNPNNGKFNLLMKNLTKDKIDLEIYNLQGEIVFTIKDFTLQASCEINLPDFQRGIYFVRAIDGEKVYSQKMVIE